MSDRFVDAAAQLAASVPLLLGWLPDDFWNATPAELAAILAPQVRGDTAPLSRGELNALMEREGDG